MTKVNKDYREATEQNCISGANIDDRDVLNALCMKNQRQ